MRNISNLIEVVDNFGLYFRYIYDNSGNVIEHHLFENIDSNTKRRTSSSKWIYEYKDGLVYKRRTFKYEGGGKWNFNDSAMYEYKLNERGQIVQIKYFNEKNEHSFTTFSNYDEIKPNKLYFYDYLGNLHKLGIQSEVAVRTHGDTVWYKIVTNDSDGYPVNIISRKLKETNATIHTYKYDTNKNIIEEAQYSNDESHLVFKTTYEYNEHGLLSKEVKYFNWGKTVEQTSTVYRYQ